MPIALQIFIVAVSVILFAFIMRLVARGRLQLKYSLLWLALAVIILICAIFPGPLFALAGALGFEVTSNFVYFLAFGMLGCIILSLSVIVSWQAHYIKSLVQDTALLDKRMQELETGTKSADGKASVASSAKADNGERRA